MALKAKNPGEVISVFDPDRGGYREVAIDALATQLRSMGFGDDEVKTKLRKTATDHLERLGYTAEEIAPRLEKLGLAED